MHTPSHFATAPEGHGEKDSPNLFGRFALRASRTFWGIIYNSIPNLRLCQRSRWRSWRPGWRK